MKVEEKRLAEEGAAAKKKADEEAARKAEEKRIADAAAAKKKADDEAAARAAETKRIADAAAAKKKADDEAAARAAEAAAAKKVEEKRIADAAAAKKKADDDAAAVVRAADEAARKKLDDKRVADAAAAKKKADDEAAARIAEAAVAKKLEEKRLAEAAAAKKADDEAAAARKKAEAAEFARGSAAAGLAAAATKKGDELVGPGLPPPASRRRPSQTVPGPARPLMRNLAGGHGLACRAAGRTIRPPAVYVVARGDTLWASQQRHYRNGRRYLALLRANDDKIGNPDPIFPCQTDLRPETETLTASRTYRRSRPPPPGGPTNTKAGPRRPAFALGGTRQPLTLASRRSKSGQCHPNISAAAAARIPAQLRPRSYGPLPRTIGPCCTVCCLWFGPRAVPT